MSTRVQQSIIIDRPVEKVFALAIILAMHTPCPALLLAHLQPVRLN